MPGTQLNIYKNFIGITSERIDKLISRAADLIRKNKYLGSKIRNFFNINDDEYNHSKIIQNILKNIPRLPMYTNNLVRRLSDTNVSTREVVDQAKLDPSLAGVILKTINSSYYSLRNKVSDLQQAILLLGFNQIYQLVVDKRIRSTMPPDTPEFKELQYHSIMVSAIGFKIAKLSSLDKPVMLITIGLLHDIGKSFILLIKSRHQNLTMLINLLDYAKIGSLLMQEWNILDIICKSVEYQKFPEFYPPEEMPAEYRKNIAILYLAHLCYENLKGKDGKDLPLLFLDEYIKLLGFTESSVTELLKIR